MSDATDFERTPGGAMLMDGNRLRDEIVARPAGEIEACRLAVGVPGDGAGRRRQAEPDLRADEAQEGRGGRHACRRASSCPRRPRRPRSKPPSPRWPPTQRCTASCASSRCPAGSTPSRCSPCCPPEKDVDGLTERSMGRLVRGLPGHVGCTPLGVMRLLERYGVPIAGKRAVGRRPFDARRAAAGAAARPQGRRRHGHARPFAHAPTWSASAADGRHHRRRRRVRPG